MVTAIIQARMNSTRLPGKILKTICGQPLLALLAERVRYCEAVDDIVIATTVNPIDDPVKKLAGKINVKCYRGSEDDVLDRFYRAAEANNAEHVVRITADCPLIDPKVTRKVIDCYLKGDQSGRPYDYVSNTISPTFPDGLDVEILGFPVLKRLHRVAVKAYQREHVTAYVAEHPQEFRVRNVAHDEDLSHLRWTVDRPEDFDLIKEIFESLYPQKRIFYMEDVLELLKRKPFLQNKNVQFKRNEGFIESLDQQGLSALERKQVIDDVLHKGKFNEV